MKKTFTHIGIVRGCDARTNPNWRRRVLLRETKRYWITNKGRRFHKTGFVGAGVGEWPLYRLIPESIEKLNNPKKI